MKRPASRSRQIGTAGALLAIVVGMAAAAAALIVVMWRHSLAWPYDAIYHDASIYLVLATMLLIGLVAAAADLARLIRRTRAAARAAHATHDASNDRRRRLE